MNTFQINDIFIHDWCQLKADHAAILLIWRDKLSMALKNGKNIIAGRYKSMIVSRLCKKKKIFKKLSADQILDIADDLNFLNASWYTFHITYLKTKHGTIYCPDERLFSFTFFQLVKADAEYSKFLVLNYQESKEQEHALNRLVAIIYQPKPGQFTDETISMYADALPRGLSFELKYLILHTYSNIRKYIVHERCPNLFNAPASTDTDSDEQPETGNIPQFTGAMFQQMMFDLSETPAFSGLENAKNARMYDALDYLEKKSIEAINRKK